MIELAKVVREFNGKELTYGTYDCNLLALKILEPDKWERLHGRYKTVLGGTRVAKKEFGYSSLLDYFRESEDYVQVPNKFAVGGDVCLITHRYDVVIHCGNALFGNLDGTFQSFAIERLNELGAEFYRRK